MRQTYAIAKAELRVLFFSPIAWLIIVIFSFQACSSFANVFSLLVNKQELGGAISNSTVELFSNWNAIYKTIQSNLYLYIPLLTMGLMSREYSSGSIKLLYSSPLDGVKVIFGKFLSIVVFAMIMLGVVLPLIGFTMLKLESADLTFMLSGFLGLSLLFFAYAAIGLYMSTLTSYQVVAAMLTLGVLAFLNNVGSMWQDINILRDITYWLSLRGRADMFIDGLITSADIMYFIIVMFIFLSLSIVKFNSGRKKESVGRLSLKHLTVLFAALFLGFLSANPRLILYFDATQVKANTLTQNSQDIINKLDGNLKITTYVNMTDRNFAFGIPRMVNMDKDRFSRYKRFIPNLKMDYVYYYDEPLSNPNYRPGISSAEDVARKLSAPYGIDFDKLLKPKEIRAELDLVSEGNTFVRLLSLNDKKQTFLRLFNDMQRHPGEAEISVALKSLVSDLPNVVFLENLSRHTITKFGDDDYTNFTVKRNNRSALINQGYNVETLDLNIISDKELNEIADILVLSDPKSELTFDYTSKILKYIESGKNMLIAVEPGREQNIKAISDELGIKFLQGVLVYPEHDFAPTLIPSSITNHSIDLSFYFRFLPGRVVTMPTAVGLDFQLGNKYETIPLTTTPFRGAWNEIETVTHARDSLKFNRYVGEVQRAIPTSFALRRMINGKEQRIVIIGDSDCLSNAELSSSRTGIESGNEFFIRAIFNWLSYDVSPLNVRRPATPDNKIYLTKKDMRKWNIILVWAIPLILSLIGVFIFIRRRRR